MLITGAVLFLHLLAVDLAHVHAAITILCTCIIHLSSPAGVCIPTANALAFCMLQPAQALQHI